MFCLLWVIFQAFALLVDGGSSGSAEEAAAKVKAAGGAVKGAKAGANAGNQGAVNGGAGAVMNGQAFLAQVVPVGGGGSFLVQQPGAGIGQPAVSQLFLGGFQQPGAPIGQPALSQILQQGGGLPLGQAANGVPLLQGQLPQLANGAMPYYVILPQPNAMGGPMTPMFLPGQQFQIIPMGAGNPQQQVVGRNGAGIARLKRWLVGGGAEDAYGSGTTVDATEATQTV